MKRVLIVTMALLLSISTLSAEERVIDHSALPKAAQTFISTHYATDKISIATMESSLFDCDYKVILTNGVKLEFDKNGNWTEIECKRNSSIPMAIVPTNAANFVNNRFPLNKIIKIEKEAKYIEFELDNDVEMKFNSAGEMVEIDY